MASDSGFVFVGRCRSLESAHALKSRLQNTGIHAGGIRRLVIPQNLSFTEKSLIAALFGAGFMFSAGAVILIFHPEALNDFLISDYILLGFAGAGASMLGHLFWQDVKMSIFGRSVSEDVTLTVEILNKDTHSLERALSCSVEQAEIDGVVENRRDAC